MTRQCKRYSDVAIQMTSGGNYGRGGQYDWCINEMLKGKKGAAATIISKCKEANGAEQWTLKNYVALEINESYWRGHFDALV